MSPRLHLIALASLLAALAPAAVGRSFDAARAPRAVSRSTPIRNSFNTAARAPASRSTTGSRAVSVRAPRDPVGLNSRFNNAAMRPFVGVPARPTRQADYFKKYPYGATLNAKGNPIRKTIVMPTGRLVDRIGSSRGYSFSRPTTSINARALKPSYGPAVYSVDRVIKPMRAHAERAKGQFGRVGGGVQVRFQTPPAIAFKRAVAGPRPVRDFAAAAGGRLPDRTYASQLTLRRMGYLSNVASSTLAPKRARQP